MRSKTISIFLAILCSGFFSQAQEITMDAPPAEEETGKEPLRVQFNEDDLPSESVTPIVDSSRAVLGKKVRFESRFEVGLQYGWIVDEMLVNQNQMGVKFIYHLDELNGVGLLYQSRFGSGTQYATQFEKVPSNILLDRAPAPTTSYALCFDQKFYYGKVSIGLDKVLTTVTESNYVLGLQKQGSKQFQMASIGLTQRFFIESHFSIGLSYRALFQQILDPTSVDSRASAPVPAEDQYTKKIQLSQVLGITTHFLF